uniref:Uncharacterized protein n=1 Tax=Nymphaea colorata TaxID=210225 RepID=A0A5K1FPU5_9MAGN
MEAATSTKT